MATPAPKVLPIHAEIHARAAALGMIAESHTATMAGHGTTGKVAWSISVVTNYLGFSDLSRARYGNAIPERVDAEMRYALLDLEAERDRRRD